VPADECPRCRGPPTRVDATSDPVKLECRSCGRTIDIGVWLPDGSYISTGSAMLTFDWVRPANEQERLRQEIARIDEMVAANKRRGQKLPADWAAYRDSLVAKLEVPATP
jgi:hypothetical protein